MKVTFIEHSGFLLETPKANFLFDYYKGEIPAVSEEIPLVVLASHKHPDHYNPEIFPLFEGHPRVHFVLHKDCGIRWKLREWEERGVQMEDRLLRVRKNETYEILLENDTVVTITTYRSTDIGVAYLLEHDGRKYYHAGDLNHWVWKEETEEFNRQHAIAYEKEMAKMKGLAVDIAFVPLDPRLLQEMNRGLELFLENVTAKKVFTMHMWKKFRVIDRFIKEHPQYGDCIVRIRKNGQTFYLDEN